MKKTIQLAIGLAVGGLLLWLVFRGTDWAKVWAALGEARWGWLALAVAAIVASFYTRVQRWSYIVRTAGPVSFRHMFSATQIGFFANFTLPGRAGEVIRALVLCRLAGLPFSRCFAFVTLDRVTDLFGVIAVMLIAALMFRPGDAIVLPPSLYAEPIPGNIVPVVAATTIAAVAGVIAALVLLYLNQRLALRMAGALCGLVSARLAEKAVAMLGHFADGLHVFRSAGDMAKSIGWSLITWFMFALSHYFTFEAFGLTYPWYAPYVVLAFLAVAIALPGAPGFIGQFHIAMVASLTVMIPAIDQDQLAALAILSHLLNLAPVAISGLWCLYREQFGLLELQRESESAGTRLDDPEPGAEGAEADRIKE